MNLRDFETCVRERWPHRQWIFREDATQDARIYFAKVASEMLFGVAVHDHGGGRLAWSAITRDHRGDGETLELALAALEKAAVEQEVQRINALGAEARARLAVVRRFTEGQG